jgi:hypothetical protein
LILEIVPEASHDAHWKKSTNDREGKLQKKFDSLSEEFSELLSVYKEASRIFIFVFS